MRKPFFASLIILFFLSACGTSATPTPTQVPPTQAPPPTAVPPTAIAASPTTSDITPTAAGPCTDAASFVADVTIPDYTHMDLHEAFTKTWRVKNTGTCPWDGNYAAVYASGDKLGGPNTIPLTNTAPGATIDISANFTAPSTDGTYKVFYHLQNSKNIAMAVDDGAAIWAIITVGKTVVYPSPTPAPTSSTANTTPGAGGTAACVAQANTGFVSQMLVLVNTARTTNGLPALTLNNQLSSAAQSHSVDMACSGALSHTGTDGSSPASRIAAAGYTASVTRENIYAQPPQYGGNPQSAMDWWMNDQIHREAILNAQVTQIGIGYAYYAKSPLGGYFTLDLAAP